MKKEIEIPSEIEANVSGSILTLKGAKGTTSKDLKNPFASFRLEGKKAVLESKKDSKKSKRVINSFAAHIKNMIEGVTRGYVYELQIAQTHFPMKITSKGQTITLENFVGEKDKRVAELRPGVKFELKDKTIVLSGSDKENVGNAAGLLEQMTRIRHKDRRTFQDGIFITKKGGNMDE